MEAEKESSPFGEEKAQLTKPERIRKDDIFHLNTPFNVDFKRKIEEKAEKDLPKFEEEKAKSNLSNKRMRVEDPSVKGANLKQKN